MSLNSFNTNLELMSGNLLAATRQNNPTPSPSIAGLNQSLSAVNTAATLPGLGSSAQNSMTDMVSQIMNMLMTILFQMMGAPAGRAPSKSSKPEPKHNHPHSPADKTNPADNAGKAGNSGKTDKKTPAAKDKKEPYPSPAPAHCYEPPVYDCGNDGKYWGDPHLVGFDGEQYDVMGKSGKIYNMLSDKDIQYNTVFEAWGKKGATVIGKAAIQVGSSRVAFDRSGTSPTVNGKAMPVGKTVQLDNNGTAIWNGTKLTVTTKEYTIDLQVEKKDHKNGAYLESNVKINQSGPFSDMVAPHGLLGQTADGIKGKKNTGIDQGKQGGTVIDGTVNDYEVPDLWSSDFKFNRFGAEIGKVVRNDETGLVEKVLDTSGNTLFQAGSLSIAA